ncbi:MAG: hypothetical protein LBV12_02445, partial [Puniceicoccales bacterium]|nr:hypothetical protein [Puniceicoccales bacterium]
MSLLNTEKFTFPASLAHAIDARGYHRLEKSVFSKRTDVSKIPEDIIHRLDGVSAWIGYMK